jgi:hypothetical protein
MASSKPGGSASKPTAGVSSHWRYMAKACVKFNTLGPIARGCDSKRTKPIMVLRQNHKGVAAAQADSQ